MQSSPDPIAQQVVDLVCSGAPLGDPEDSHLVDLLAQLERLANAAGAVQAEVMVEMSRRAQLADGEDERERGRTLMSHEGRAEFVPDEVAVTLACTKAAAAHRYGLALAVAEHPAVLAAWRRGTIDARKVQVICEGLTDVSSPAARGPRRRGCRLRGFPHGTRGSALVVPAGHQRRPRYGRGSARTGQR